MSNIKLRYVAQVVIDAQYPRLGSTMSIEEIRERIMDETAENIKKLLVDRICPSWMGAVQVIEQYINVYEVEEES